jgi:uncharacterized protein (TIGR02594 family)
MLPQQYQWLGTITPPNTIKEALKLYGIKEKIGTDDNPIIMDWADECNITGYSADSIPWCGLFVSVVVTRAGWERVASPLWARDWLHFGVPSDVPSLGDVLVFSRDGGGHVGFYIGEDSACYHVLGGNQSDSVCVTRINKVRLLGARRPKWKVAKPASVIPYKLLADGGISTNER